MNWFSPRLIGVSLCATFAVAAWAAPPKQVGSKNPQAIEKSPENIKKIRETHRTLAEDFGKPVLKNGKTEQKGTLRLQVMEARPPHDLAFRLIQPQGGGVATMVVEDKTDNSLANFAYDTEKGTFKFGTTSANTTLSFNPDGTVSLDGKVYKDATEAGQAMLLMDVTRQISNESWRAVIEVLNNANPDQNAKVWQLIASAAEAIGSVIGYAADCLMEVCCDQWCGEYWIWEVTCVDLDTCVSIWNNPDSFADNVCDQCAL